MEEEAGEAAQRQERVDHVGCHGGALAAAVDRRQHHLESEEGTGGEEVGQQRGFGESLLHAVRHRSPLAAAALEGRVAGGRRRGGVERWRVDLGGRVVDSYADSF